MLFINIKIPTHQAYRQTFKVLLKFTKCNLQLALNPCLHITVHRQNYNISYNLNHFTWPKANTIFTILLIFPLKISLMKIFMAHCCSFKTIKILSIVTFNQDTYRDYKTIARSSEGREGRGSN